MVLSEKGNAGLPTPEAIFGGCDWIAMLWVLVFGTPAWLETDGRAPSSAARGGLGSLLLRNGGEEDAVGLDTAMAVTIVAVLTFVMVCVATVVVSVVVMRVVVVIVVFVGRATVRVALIVEVRLPAVVAVTVVRLVAGGRDS